MDFLFMFNLRILPDGISLAELIISIPINRKNPIKFDFDDQAMISTMLTKNKRDQVEWKNYKNVRRRSSLWGTCKRHDSIISMQSTLTLYHFNPTRFRGRLTDEMLAGRFNRAWPENFNSKRQQNISLLLPRCTQYTHCSSIFRRTD